MILDLSSLFCRFQNSFLLFFLLFLDFVLYYKHKKRSIFLTRKAQCSFRQCDACQLLMQTHFYWCTGLLEIRKFLSVVLSLVHCLFVYVWIIDCLQTFSQRTHKSNLSPLIYFNFSIFAYFYLFWLCCTYLNIYVFAVSTVQFRLKSLNNASKRSKKFEQIIR